MEQHRAMRKQISAVLALAAIALLGGCAILNRSEEPVVVGTWTNLIGTIWAIKADGTFEVSLGKSHRVDVWGTYTVTGDTMTIQEARGSLTPKSCKAAATYKFKRDDDTLTFTKVSDKCKLRETNMLLPWKPWKGK